MLDPLAPSTWLIVHRPRARFRMDYQSCRNVVPFSPPSGTGEEYIVPVTLHPDGTFTDEDGNCVGPFVE
jgi:hypothetical protein